jgi:hypothetical protein
LPETLRFRADDLIDTFGEWLTSDDELREKVATGVARTLNDASLGPYAGADAVLSAIAEYARKDDK